MKSRSQLFLSIWIFSEALSQQKAPTVPSIWIALIKFIWAGERHLCTISFLVGRVCALSWDEIILVSSLYLMRDENRICARFSNFPPHWYCLYFIERWDCAFLYLRKTRFVQNFLPHCCCFCCQGEGTVRMRLFFFQSILSDEKSKFVNYILPHSQIGWFYARQLLLGIKLISSHSLFAADFPCTI